MNKKILTIFFLILLLGVFLRLYKLGQQSFIADEYLGINIAWGQNQSGEWKFWDFNEEKITDETYTRSQVYYWQVARVFDFLAPTEFNARLVSVFWGMVSIISIFLISFWTTKKWSIALIAAFFWAVSLSALTYDRKLRMYSMFAPAYLWFSFFVFKFLESKTKKKWRWLNFVCEKTNFNWSYLIPMVVLGLISLLTHLLTVNIFPVVAFYFLVQGLVFWKKRSDWKNHYLIQLAILIGFAMVVTFLSVSEVVTKEFGFWIGNWSYLEKMLFDYGHYLIATIFFAFGAYCLIKEHGKIGFWIVINFLIPLILAILVWKRSAGYQYIYFVQSFKMIIVAAGIYYLSRLLKDKLFPEFGRAAGIFMVFFVVVLVNLSFFFSKDSFFENPKKWNQTNYREVFGYFLKHSGENSALIARPLTNYYLARSETQLITYGPDDNLTLEDVWEAQDENDEVWVIFSKGTYIKGAARQYIRSSFELIETSYTNGKLEVWRWKKKILATSEPLKIGFTTDIQCYGRTNSETDQWELNWRCTAPAEIFVKRMNNNFKPDLVIDGGDFIDGKDDHALDDFGLIRKIYEKVDAPHYYVLGNHETREFLKKDWLELVGYKKTYYYVDVRNYRVIVLDGNFKPDGQDTTPEKHYYPGFVNEEQMEWLKDLLLESGDREVIVFVHQPLIETYERELKKMFYNGDELRRVLEKFGVRAVFSGHIEQNCFEKREETNYVVQKGFWKQQGDLKKELRLKDSGSFSEITIGENVEVKVYNRKGKATGYVPMILSAQTADCMNPELYEK